jgi:arginine/ornithine transport system substrate-binding protein
MSKEVVLKPACIVESPISKRRQVVQATLLCLAVLAFQGQAWAQEKLRISTEGTYAPWSFQDAQGKLMGWDIDIANALCAKMKVQCEISAQEWDGIIPALLAKKHDAIVASMAMTPARRERVAFTNKYKDVISQFLAPKNTISDTSPQGLKGKKIGVQRGSAQQKWLEAEGYNKTAEIRLYERTTDSELDLVAGRVDVIVGNKTTMFVGFLKKPEAKDMVFVGPELRGGVLGDGAGIALRKEDVALRERFNKALDEIRADGTYDAITRKYFPFKLM